MPNVTAIPRGQSNGQVVTEFIDSVGTSSVTYTFPKSQETLYVKNTGEKSISVTVGGVNQTIQPWQKWEASVAFDSFNIVSTNGIQSFEVRSEETGLNPNDTVSQQLNSQIVSLSKKASERKIVCFGDSWTEGGAGNFSYSDVLNWTTDMNFINKGITGNYTYDLLNRIQADVINLRPSMCIVCIGVNDAHSSTPVTTYMANVVKIASTLMENSIRPVFITVPPNTVWGATVNELVRQYNRALTDFCRRNYTQYIDIYDMFIDSSGNADATKFMGDGVHQNGNSQVALASRIKTSLGLESNRTRYYAGEVQACPNNLFLTDTNADGFADNWISENTEGATATYQLTAHPRIGKWQQITRSGGASTAAKTNIYAQMTTGFTVGKYFDFEADVDTDANMSNCAVGIRVEAYAPGFVTLDTATASYKKSFIAMNATLNDMRVGGSLLIPSGTTIVVFKLYFTGSTAAVARIGNIVARTRADY